MGPGTYHQALVPQVVWFVSVGHCWSGWECQDSSHQHQGQLQGSGRPTSGTQVLRFSFVVKTAVLSPSCTDSSSLLQPHWPSCALDMPSSCSDWAHLPLSPTYLSSRTHLSLLWNPRISCPSTISFSYCWFECACIPVASHSLGPPLDCKLHQSQDFLWFASPVYFQHLFQCLALNNYWQMCPESQTGQDPHWACCLSTVSGSMCWSGRDAVIDWWCLLQAWSWKRWHRCLQRESS